METKAKNELVTSTDSMHSRLEEVEEIIGYKFSDKALLRQALTDGSYKDDDHCVKNERLAYLGDAVLNLLTTKEQYYIYPDKPPFEMTRLRAVNVDAEMLARAAFKLDLHKYLRHNQPLLQEHIREFKEGIAKYPLYSFGLLEAPKVLADIITSTIGAIFIDSDSSIDITWQVAKIMLEPRMGTPEIIQTHPMTKLYEICKKK